MRNGIEVERVVSNRKIVEPLLLMAQILKKRSGCQKVPLIVKQTLFAFSRRRKTVL